MVTLGFSRRTNYIQQKRANLPYACCEGGTVNSHFRKWAYTEYQKRVKYDIYNTARHKSCHGGIHSADGLEDFFVCKAYHNYNRKRKTIVE